MKRIFVTILIFVGFSLCKVLAQKDEGIKHELRLLARPTSDSIMLRWAPTTYRFWLVGNKYGYRVTKTMLYKDGELVQNRKTILLTPEPLKPRPLSDWELLDANNDSYAGVAAQSIYGDSFDVEAGEEDMGMIDIFNKATEQENRFGFALFAADQSIEVAKHHGLMIIDKDVKPGEKYLYRVFHDSVPADMKKDTAFFFTGVDEYLPLPSPADVKAKGGDGSITITWDNKYQTDYFNSFWIERSQDGGKSFKRLNDLPMINTTQEGYDEAPYHYYLDTIPDNSKEYSYRVIGISVFGELSPPSKVVIAHGVDQITSVPLITNKYSGDGKTVTIEWEFANEKKERVEGFRIYRSKEYSKGFSLIADSISVMKKKFKDMNPLSTGYYRLQAFNSHGGGGYSIPQMVQVIDSMPPLKPIGLEAVADTSGKVIISWKPNAETDIYGYRIYRANVMHEEFSAITPRPVKDTTFIDHITVNTLTKKVYYKIRAYDQTQNQSDFSDVLELKRPDIIPPVAPLIRKITPTNSGIVLTWANSPSKDVEKILLYRNRAGSANWKLIQVLPADSINSLTDKPEEGGYVYRYLIMAVDDAGNESKPNKPVSAKYNPRNNKDGWITPKVKEIKRKEVIELTWDVPSYSSSRFIIYARTPEGQWNMIDGVNGNTYKYESSYYYGKEVEFIIQPR